MLNAACPHISKDAAVQLAVAERTLGSLVLARSSWLAQAAKWRFI
jgi:hypothetical protein